MYGKFEVKLLNQFDSRDHHTKEVMSSFQWIDRATDSYVSWVITDFISHDELLHGKAKFLKNDTLYFEVAYKDSPLLELLLISIVILVYFCTFIYCIRIS